MDLDGAWSSRWVSAPPEHGLSWVMVATRHSPVQKALEASDIALSLASKVFQLLLTPPCSSGHSYMPRLRCNRTHCKNGLRERTRTLGPGTKPMEDSSDRGSGFKIPVTATSSKMFRRISTDENNSSQRATLHEFMEEEEEKERSEEREGQASTQAPPKRRPEVVPDMSWRTRRVCARTSMLLHACVIETSWNYGTAGKVAFSIRARNRHDAGRSDRGRTRGS
eukprot:scaffold147029_cov19-Tisochrysis_lutea.AAC.2